MRKQHPKHTHTHTTTRHRNAFPCARQLTSKLVDSLCLDMILAVTPSLCSPCNARCAQTMHHGCQHAPSRQTGTRTRACINRRKAARNRPTLGKGQHLLLARDAARPPPCYFRKGTQHNTARGSGKIDSNVQAPTHLDSFQICCKATTAHPRGQDTACERTCRQRVCGRAVATRREWRPMTVCYEMQVFTPY